MNRVFHHAAALGDPAAREAYLQTACAGAPEVLAEVRELLAWDETTPGFLDEPVAHVAEWPTLALQAAAVTPLSEPTGGESLIGTALGSWRITGIIGSGGMGSVYRAERADAAFQRQAAIKVLRLGRDSAPMVERFRRERETLAALDHPNIARLLDGGTTATGQPYFVMEFVDGVPIDRYCDEHRLTVDQRLALFRAVCAGVQYAHENLIIHRDIKPDNILVTHDGTAKLLDFGIAKLLSEGHTPADDAGAAVTWLMTPDYASPEQLFGRATPTLSGDAYSLGVLLYLLLTGVRPYHLRGTTRSEVQAQLDAAVLRAPSARVTEADPRTATNPRAAGEPRTTAGGQTAADSRTDAEDQTAAGAKAYAEELMTARAAARCTTPRALARRLSGDLDAIVLRALGREPSARYSTVDQLAGDLERHRTGHPVTARGGDLPYLVTTFVRRHALALTLLTLLVAAAVAVMGVIIWQARVAAEARSRAEHRFDDVRRLAHAFMFDVHDAVVNIPGTTRARMVMVKTALDYLERLAHEAASDRDLQRELAAAFVRVGDAQGHPTSPNLGDTAGALASYRRAIAIAGALVTPATDDVAAERTLALAHRRLADVLAWRGDMAEALAQCQTSASLFAAIAARPSPTLDDRLQAAIGHIKVGDLLGNPNVPNLGRTADADAQFSVALSALRPMAASAEAQKDFRVRRYLGLTLERVGVLRERAQRWPDAAAAYRESFDIRQALAMEQPLHTDILRDAGIAYEKLGNIERFMKNLPAAARNHRGALARFQQLAAADPLNTTASRTVAIGQENLAETLRQLRQSTEAGTLVETALATHRSLAARDASSAQARCDVGRAAETLGDLRALGSSSPSAAACSYWSESLQIRQELVRAGADTCTDREEVARVVAKAKPCR